jgi:basic membrane protein A
LAKEIAEGYKEMKTRMLALLTVLGLVVAACGGSTESPSASVDAGKGDYKACLALDVGGIGDKSFNDSAYEGLLEAEAAGYDTQYSEAKSGADYEANIQLLIDEGCKSIIVVGFSQGAAVDAATVANPDIAFSHVDSIWRGGAEPAPANFTGLDFQIDEASMLASYAASMVSSQKKLGVFGGGQFDGVTRFMDGWVAGANYYAEETGTAVEVFGWDPVAKTGTFAPSDNPWGNKEYGKSTAEQFMSQGADFVHPVAGQTGEGTYEAMLAAEKYAVGVDADQCLTLPDYCGTLLTSAMKLIGPVVFATIEKNYAGDMGGENLTGTLSNGGVGIAPLDRTEAAWTATFGSLVTADVIAKVEALKAKIISGEVKVSDYFD